MHADRAFYGRDLAHVHDAAFGDLARAGAAELLERLRGAGIASGLVVDLGTGSGIAAQALTEAGYAVLGVDVSADLLELARRRAPGATFVEASLHEFQLPACAAVTAIGECLSYANAGRPELTRLFARVHDALSPGGLFLFDVACPGREAAGPRRTWHEGADWILCFEAEERAAERLLTRRITVFRRAGDAYRRSDEVHTLHLYEPAEVLEQLVRAGFEATQLPGYVGRLRFVPGHAGFAAVRRAL